MNEYIKRKDAFEILQSRLDSISQMSYLNMDWHELDIMRDAIQNAIDDVGEVPAADVQPVKHGRWITKSDVFYIAWQESGRSWDDMPYFVTGRNFACSNCFAQYDVNAEGVEKWNGCPLCLAKMEGEKE